MLHYSDGNSLWLRFFCVWLPPLYCNLRLRYLPGNFTGPIKERCSFRKSRAIKWYFSYWLAGNITSKLMCVQFAMTSIALDFKSDAYVSVLMISFPASVWLRIFDLFYSLLVLTEFFSKKLKMHCFGV
ncbi:hypothetical protein FCM35_KLT08248 [Carex littledalei]|uniref:Uncharacterized protein n=1 Tax=Carex littledalei TaxID=544730 RepID=A0A833QX84_9POAL|nr:hypothetical protein FCM35_KLT08248 [Carex littledalei]